MGYDIEKEKREAIEAGRRALNSLQAAKENLNSAKNWGLVDMFGGGFFTTMLKHSKMDQAKRNMEQAKYDLRNFRRSLSDRTRRTDFRFCPSAADPAVITFIIKRAFSFHLKALFLYHSKLPIPQKKMS